MTPRPLARYRWITGQERPRTRDLTGGPEAGTQGRANTRAMRAITSVSGDTDETPPGGCDGVASCQPSGGPSSNQSHMSKKLEWDARWRARSVPGCSPAHAPPIGQLQAQEWRDSLHMPPLLSHPAPFACFKVLRARTPNREAPLSLARAHHYRAEVIMANQPWCWMRSATPLAAPRPRRDILIPSWATTWGFAPDIRRTIRRVWQFEKPPGLAEVLSWRIVVTSLSLRRRDDSQDTEITLSTALSSTDWAWKSTRVRARRCS